YRQPAQQLDSGLQCGHGLSTVETYWRLYRHTRRKSFNAATAFRPWRRYQEVQEPLSTLASMRPRPFDRGDRRWKTELSVNLELQCGHGLSTVETRAK